MEGIIYKYVSPIGKVYIGQTLCEKRRRKEFLNLKVNYSGNKIDNARKKYGPENFKYEVIERKKYNEINEALNDLNYLESYYIGKYNSYEDGYNMTYGGEGVRGLVFNDEVINKIKHTLSNYYKTHDNPFKGKKHTEKTKTILREKALGRPSPFKGKKLSAEQKQKISERVKKQVQGEKNPFYGKKHSEQTKKKIGIANSKPVLQIDIKSGKVLNSFVSAKEAAEYLGKKRGNSEIIKVCKKYVSPIGKHYKSAFGFKWEYDTTEGSTTSKSL